MDAWRKDALVSMRDRLKRDLDALTAERDAHYAVDSGASSGMDAHRQRLIAEIESVIATLELLQRDL